MKTTNTFLISFLILCGHFSQAQNLVPNPSFENYKKLRCTGIDENMGIKNPDSRLVFDSILYDWKLPTTLASDIYSLIVDVKTCDLNPFHDGYGPNPKDGFNMANIALMGNHLIGPKNGGGRSYIQTKLNNRLKGNHQYLGGGYQTLDPISFYAANNLGMLFTTEPVRSDTNLILSYTPQINQTEVNKDQSIWKKFYGCFTAVGEEEYLTIGGFIDDEHTTFIKLDPGNGGFVSDYSLYFIDSVFVEEINLYIPNVITPNGDRFNEKFVIDNLHFGWWSLDVFNRWGGQVYHSSDYRNTWSGDNLSSGVYYYHLKHRCENVQYKGTLSIIR